MRSSGHKGRDPGRSEGANRRSFHTYENGGLIFLSRRFADFCKEQKPTNLHCCPASEWGRSMFGAEFFDDAQDA